MIWTHLQPCMHCVIDLCNTHMHQSLSSMLTSGEGPLYRGPVSYSSWPNAEVVPTLALPVWR
jgi:hypothetical protein